MEESPIFSRNPRRKSRYSLYQSDYETAGEDSDSSLYYSVLEDLSEENDRNKENSMKQHNGQHSLLGKCLQKNMNLTPRCEFNKRVSFNLNPLIPPKFISSTLDISTQVFDFEKSSTDEVDACAVIDPSLNSIIGNQADSTTGATEGETSEATEETRSESTEAATIEATEETRSESTEGTISEAIEGVQIRKAASTANASTSVLDSTLKTTDIPRVETAAKQFGQASNTQNISTTLGLSNLPIPKKIFIAELPNPPAITLKPCVPSRLSLFRGHSTKNNVSSRTIGKTGIPRVSTMAARNNSLLHTSVIPLSSLTCKYCGKSFAKPPILQLHLLEKCDKIPTARHRQLSRQ